LISEVRLAPQIDSLVTIYKNMEAASGINLFGTQNPPATKSLGSMPFISMQSFTFFCFSEEFIACYYD
jgi:BRCA1-associated RING domain protein 1